jgi:anaerobic magnesium-protoporphyrin IX monomethyl ester cyclase
MVDCCLTPMNKYKILLVRVPEIEISSKRTDLRSVSIGSLTIPLGITYIASAIRNQNHHDVNILDLYAECYEIFISECVSDPFKLITLSKNILANAILQYRPDIVGFSAPFLFQHNLVKELINFAKESFPLLRIYMGGYSTIVPNIVMKDILGLDVLFIGEADKTIIRVLDMEGSNSRYDNIKGISYRCNNKIITNNSLDLISNINDISYPSFDMLPLNKYNKILGRNEFPIMTSRSCPFSCNYCSSFLYSGRGLRLRKIDNLLGEMELLHKKYNIDFLFIRDDNFNVNKEHIKQYLRSLLKNNMTVPWCDSNGLHVNSIDEEILDLCKASGCSEIIFAVESGCERVLKDIMNKKVDLKHALKMARYCNEIDLPLQCYFVIGNPGETKDEIKQTIDFARELQVDSCTFSIATPFPGTKYYDLAVEKGYLIHKSDYILGMKYMETNLETELISSDDLKDIQYDANMRINFLENRLLYGDTQALKKALQKYIRIFKQYNFHVIALLIQGYIYSKLGNHAECINKFKNVKELLKNQDIDKAYGKYIQWDTPVINYYREWLNNGE